MTVKMKGPEGHSGLSHQGNSYEPDADGVIEVPHEALGEAMNHGFVILAEQAAPGGSPTAPATPPVNLTKMNKKQLVTHAKTALDLDLDESLTAKDMIAAIETKAAEPAAGDEQTSGDEQSNESGAE
jgi:hypothetical protein